MPDEWNLLNIVSLHKKGSVQDPNNFRGLSIMSVFPKLYSTIINSKLVSVANQQQLRAETQAGFRKYHRVDDNCLILKTIVERAVLEKQPLFAVFVDLSKAYDSISRERLWNVLLGELNLDENLVKAL